MKVVGIDPSLRSTGVALYQVTGARREVLRHQTIRTATEGTERRMASIMDALSTWILAGGVDGIAIEHQAGVQIAKTMAGRTNAQAGYVREVARLAWTIARMQLLPVVWVRPNELRSGLGLRANASKASIQDAVRSQIVWPSGRYSEHVADAAAVAVVGERKLRLANSRGGSARLHEIFL